MRLHHGCGFVLRRRRLSGGGRRRLRHRSGAMRSAPHISSLSSERRCRNGHAQCVPSRREPGRSETRGVYDFAILRRGESLLVFVAGIDPAPRQAGHDNESRGIHERQSGRFQRRHSAELRSRSWTDLFAGYAADVANRVASSGAGSRVLETAAGSGIVTRALRDALPTYAHLTATDLNPDMLAIGAGEVPCAARRWHFSRRTRRRCRFPTDHSTR